MLRRRKRDGGAHATSRDCADLVLVERLVRGGGVQRLEHGRHVPALLQQDEIPPGVPVHELGDVVHGITHNEPHVVALVVLLHFLGGVACVRVAGMHGGSGVLFGFGNHDAGSGGMTLVLW